VACDCGRWVGSDGGSNRAEAIVARRRPARRICACGWQWWRSRWMRLAMAANDPCTVIFTQRTRPRQQADTW